MPNSVALGCLEVGEKFVVGGWGGVDGFCGVGGGISIPTTRLLQP